MNVRELVGQCLMVGFPEPELTPEVRRLLTEEMIGSIVLFARNLRDPASAGTLCEDLQAVARAHLPAPLMIGTDQEGGAVERLGPGATPLPSAMAIGAAGPDAARTAAEICARELRAVGIDQVLAPVLDVNIAPRNPVIGTRSFGGSPEAVAACGVAAVEGYRAGGVAATAKHFPGHGDSAVDSHLALPVLPHDLERLERVELAPFRAAVAAGVDVVMVGHLAVPALDPSGAPASVSRPLTRGLLRERIGFQGVVMTDCMEMAGVSPDAGFGRVAVAAFLAGADLVLVSHRPDRQREAAAALREAAASGRIPMTRLRESADRVLALKRRLAAAPRPSLGEVGSPGHRAAMDEVAARAVTVLRAGVLGGRLAAVSFQGGAMSGAESAQADDPFLAAAGARGIPTMRLPLEPGQAELEEALGLAGAADGLLIGSRRLSYFPAQARAARALARARPAALIALREPYDLAEVPEAVTLVAAYGDRSPVVEVALGAALGERHGGGRLPVEVAAAGHSPR